MRHNHNINDDTMTNKLKLICTSFITLTYLKHAYESAKLSVMMLQCAPSGNNLFDVRSDKAQWFEFTVAEPPAAIAISQVAPNVIL